MRSPLLPVLNWDAPALKIVCSRLLLFCKCILMYSQDMTVVVKEYEVEYFGQIKGFLCYIKK